MELEKEIELLHRLQSGDKDAFKTVFDRYFKLLYLEAYSRLKNEKEAEDLVQDFFIDLWEKGLHQSIHFSLKSYVFQSIRNRCYNKLEHGKVETQRTARYLIGHTSSVLQPNRMENNELKNHLKLAMDTIPPESARVFRLMYIEQKKRKEVANILGISENTVKTQLARAIRYLRQRLINITK